MLNNERIKQAESNVRSYLEDDLLKKIYYQDKVFKTFQRNYLESINVAKILLEKNYSHLWTIVISYYSMYYVANAVLYKIGYKIGRKIVHKVTADALIVFVRNKIKKTLLEEYEEQKEEALEIVGKKTESLLYEYEREMSKRSTIQYESTEEVKKAKAETSFDRAKRFVQEMEKLL